MKEEVKAELVRLTSRAGRLNPEEIVREARKKRSPLHDEFDWNDASAAHSHRIEQARDLIQRFVVVLNVQDTTTQIRVPAYVSDPDRGRASQYRSTSNLKMDPDAARRSILPEAKTCRSHVERVRNLTDLYGFDVAHIDRASKELDRFIEQLSEPRDSKKAA